MEGDSYSCKISRWQILKARLNNLTPEEFQQMIYGTRGAVIIDVRTQEEFRQGHLRGAINIDYLAYDFWDRIEKLNPERPYLVYCRSGRRSIRTCTLMKNGGFAKVYNLDGGLKGWEQVFGMENEG